MSYKNIQWIILDVDGVVVGTKVGFNSPDPHPNVISRLKKIRHQGIGVSLLTAKPYFGIKSLIQYAHLNNLHITDGGSVIIDPINNVIAKKYVLDNQLAQQVLQICLTNNVYVEFYSVDHYSIQRDQVSDITKKHEHILQQTPEISTFLVTEAKAQEIVKIMPIALDEQDKKRVVNLLEPFYNKLEINWSIHPVALPLQFGIITPLGVSKAQGAKDISEMVVVPFDNMLAVGDRTHDWQFINLCKYGATVSNAEQELKDLVHTKGDSYSYIGGDVDENGVLDIFDHFNL